MVAVDLSDLPIITAIAWYSVKVCSYFRKSVVYRAHAVMRGGGVLICGLSIAHRIAVKMGVNLERQKY